MKYNDHYALGKYITEVYAIEKTSQKFWFLLGNVLPDINKATYLQGYGKLRDKLTEKGEPLSLNDRRRLMIAGHTAEGSRYYVNKYTKIMRRRYHGVVSKKPSWYSWYQIGKLTHYVADRFTYPHTLRCRYDFWTHVDYEELLHVKFSRLIKEMQKNGREQAERIRNIVSDLLGQINFDSLYKAYRSESRQVETDCIYILAACVKYMGYILPRHV